MTAAARKYNYSRQREVIYRILAGTTSHPTAEWVHQQARRELPSLSLGTVYRNLQILRDQGRIREMTFGASQTRYDAMMEPHHHFICTGCGAMYDLHLVQAPTADLRRVLPAGATVETLHIECYGRCASCA